jgi:hypothetical protein
MTHKQKCIEHCKGYLQQLNLNQYFSETLFMHIYRKQNGAQGNAFSIGINAADHIINNSKPNNYASRNKTEA